MLFSERINGSILHSSARFSRASAFGAARNYRSKNKFLFVRSKNSRIHANFFNFFLFFNRWMEIERNINKGLLITIVFQSNRVFFFFF